MSKNQTSVSDRIHLDNQIKKRENKAFDGNINQRIEDITTKFREKVLEDQYSLYYVDFDNEMLTVIKQTSWSGLIKPGTSMPYAQVMKLFVGSLSGEAKEFFAKMSNIENLRQRFLKEEKITYSYVSDFGAGMKWVSVTGFVVERHEDKTPAGLSLGFSTIDDLSADRLKMQKQIEENYNTLHGISAEYTAIYHVNLDSGEYQNNYATEKVSDIIELFGKYDKTSDLFEYYVEEKVHPDNRKQLRELYGNEEALQKTLKGKKRISTKFKRKYNDRYLWTEMTVVKCDSVEEEAHEAIVGFVECDDEIRSSATLQNCLTILGKEDAPDDLINELLTLAGEYYEAERVFVFEYGKTGYTISGTYEWCTEGEKSVKNNIKDVPAFDINRYFYEFEESGFVTWNEKFDRNNKKGEGVSFLKKQGAHNFIAVPVMRDTGIIGIVIALNTSGKYRDHRVLKTVASVIHSEILRRKEKDEEYVTLKKLTDAFVSVYYVDLTTDYMRTWKISDEYREIYGETKHYSISMGGYIRNYVADRDRERCIEMTSPDFILTQFEMNDRFSIEMTDIMNGHERNYVFDYIKVNEEGTRLVICCRDLTETLMNQKAQQDVLEEALFAAKAANEAKTTFLFNMSHDIRTPMNAILGYTDIAIRNLDDKERAKDSLKRIKTSSMHLLRLINDILEMSRIESGNLEIAEHPLDVREAIAEIEHMSRALAINKNIEFNVEIGQIENNYIYADELHINEVLINLISNAVKYTECGGKVKLSVCQKDGVSEGMSVYKCEVSDNGIGMSEAFQEHLFETFSREKTATVSKTEGAGLGLSIVKRIVDKVGGNIEVKSKTGEGSVFTLEIPFKVMNDEAIEKYLSEKKENAEIKENVSYEGKNILLVEDNEMNSEIATDILTNAGFEVETAEDGDVAVKKVIDRGIDYYDFILMDIQMPVMNGFEATKAIRNLPGGGRVPIIALSANAFEEDRQKSLASGMNAHIAKPIDVRILLTTLKELSATI